MAFSVVKRLQVLIKHIFSLFCLSLIHIAELLQIFNTKRGFYFLGRRKAIDEGLKGAIPWKKRESFKKR
jgi:hypothetical protein